MELLEARSKSLKTACSRQSRMDWAKYDKDCLLHVKKREQEQIKVTKARINKLMMEMEQAEKVDSETRIAGYKKQALDQANQNVIFEILFT